MCIIQCKVVDRKSAKDDNIQIPSLILTILQRGVGPFGPVDIGLVEYSIVKFGILDP